MRYVLTLAALPLTVLPFYRHAPAPPPAAKLVQVEGVRAVRMDDETFGRRWLPALALPPMIEVRHVAATPSMASAVPGPVAVPAPQPSAGAPRHHLRSKPAQLDVCARHHMRKVFHGRSWNCRK